LGLCEEGMVKGVVSGNYCRSKKNKDYAIKAVKLLNKFPEMAENKILLWNNVAGASKAHNNQLDVVIALWDNKYINV